MISYQRDSLNSRRQVGRAWWYERGLAVRSLLSTVVIAALLVCLVFACVEKSHLFSRTGLPAFDHQKAAQLTTDRRKAYEQELFAELQQWNIGSKHYPKVEDIPRRERRWMEMAADGFELAYITLQVLEPSTGAIHALADPVARLEELATGGDIGAMCLIPGIVNLAAIKHDWRPYSNLVQRSVANGAKLGHPQCLKELGGRLLLGVPGFVKDVSRGLDLEFAARSAGYAHDVGALILHFRSKGNANLDDVRRHYCWGVIHETLWLDDRSGPNLQNIEQEAKRTGRADLAQLASELKASRYTLRECIQLGKGN